MYSVPKATRPALGEHGSKRRPVGFVETTELNLSQIGSGSLCSEDLQSYSLESIGGFLSQSSSSNSGSLKQIFLRARVEVVDSALGLKGIEDGNDDCILLAEQTMK